MMNVDASVTAEHLRSLFQHFGVTVVGSERLYVPPILQHDDSRLGRGGDGEGKGGERSGLDASPKACRIPLETVVLEFENGTDAAKALRAMDGGFVNGKCVRLQPVFEAQHVMGH